MEDTKKIMTEELNQMKGLMGFKAGMTRTELKDKLMTQLAEEAEDIKKEEGSGEVVESGDGFKLEKLQAQGQQSEDDNAITPSEDMFEQPEIQAGGPKMTQGFEDTEIPIYDMKTYFKRIMQNPKNINKFYNRLSKGTYGGKPALDAIKTAYKDYSGEDLPIKEKKLDVTPEVANNTPELDQPTAQPTEKGFNMTQGFVNESVSNKEQKRINKEARLNKKLGIIEEQFATPAMLGNMAARQAKRQVTRAAENPRVAARQSRRADRRSDRSDSRADRRASRQEPNVDNNIEQDVDGKVYTDFDSVWDYKFEDGMWYTHKKGQEKWISLANYPKAIEKLNAKYFPGANNNPAAPVTPADPVPQVAGDVAPGKIDTSKIASPNIPTSRPDKIG